MTERQWQRRYKMLACVGAMTLLVQGFEVLAYYLTRQYAIPVTYLSVPILFGLGYGVQKLFLIGRSDDVESMTFAFETEKTTVPPARRLFACLLSGVAAAIIGRMSFPLFVRLLGDAANTEVGGVLFVVACILTAEGGCLLQPLRFHQLVSIRTAVEFFGIYAALFAVQIVYGRQFSYRYIGLSYLLCLVIYSICLFILMNQEYVIKPAFTFEACHATDRMRRAGIRSVLTMLTLTLALCPFVLCMLVFLAVTVRLIVLPTVRIFDVPFPGMWGLNTALYIIGLVVFLVAVLLFVALAGRKAKTAIYVFFHDLIGGIAYFVHDFFLWFLHVFRKESNYFYPSEGVTREQTPHYVDTVVFVPPDKQTDTAANYRAFAKRLRRYETNSEKFCFAYRVLLGDLYAAGIGIKQAQTPTEVARVVKEKTNMTGFDRWTELFVYELYGQRQSATSEDVAEICAMVEARFSKTQK